MAIFVAEPLLALQNRPGEELEPRAGDWQPHIENHLAVGREQVADGPIDDYFERLVAFKL